MGQGILDFVWDVLDERAPEDHVEKLLAAADPEYREVPLERRPGDGEFKVRASCLQLDGIVPVVRAEQHGVDIEMTAGDDQAINRIEVGRRPRTGMR